MKLSGLVTVVMLCALCAAALPPAPRAPAQEVKLKFKTEVQVNQAGGGDLEVWDDEFAFMGPTGLYFRWRTSEAWATAGTWQISERPLGLDTSAAAMMQVIRQGQVKLNQEKRGDYAGFSVSLAGLVAPKPPKTPKKYYLRVVPLDARGKIVGPPSPPVVITYREPGPPPAIDVPYEEGRPIRVRVRLERFKVVRGDEDDGDEPYLLAAVFFTDGTTVSAFDFPNSSATILEPAEKGHGNLIPAGVSPEKEFFAGEEVEIRPEVGLFEREIRPVPGLNSYPDKAERMSLVGVVVFAVEEDATVDQTAVSQHRRVVEELRRRLDRRIRETTRQTIDAFPKAVDESLKSLTALPALGFGSDPSNPSELPAAFDPDDLLGGRSVVYSYRHLRNAGWMTFDMDFKKDGVHYVVKGKMEVVK